MRLGLLAIVVLAQCVGGCKGNTIASKSDPDVMMARGDQDISSAAQKSRSELPRFLERLQHPQPGEQFAVNANFREHGTFEHMWVDHLKYDGRVLTGRLADQPVLLRGMKKGDMVVLSTQMIYDWLIHSHSKTEGGYVQEALMRKRGN